MPKKETEQRPEERSPPQIDTPESRFRVEKYGKSRHFAVYDGEKLLAVTVYKKGAEAIRHRLEEYETLLAAKTQIIEQMTDALVTSSRSHSATPQA